LLLLLLFSFLWHFVFLWLLSHTPPVHSLLFRLVGDSCKSRLRLSLILKRDWTRSCCLPLPYESL
jgi:hypothetical protein